MSNKIQFKKIRSKNFRSFGNQFFEIDLTQKSTLVCSDDNGAGKSTGIVHALSFVLFDTPYQNRQKKASLVNSRNGKDCVVEVEFTTKGADWHVSRGIKPNFLKIVKNGVLIENEASLKDPQKFLEETVLGFNEKIFFNIALLGRDKFVSFAEMSASETRGFVEVLLDQGIFSVMNEVAKEDLKKSNREIDDIGAEIRTTANKISNSVRVLSLLESKLQEKRQFSNDLVVAIDNEISALDAELVTLQLNETVAEDEVSKFVGIIEQEQKNLAVIDAQIGAVSVATYREANNRIKMLSGQFTTKIDLLSSQKKLFLDKTSCPSCEQPITEARKHDYCAKADPEILTLQTNKQTLEDRLIASETTLAEKEKEIALLREKRNAFKSSAPELANARSTLNSIKSQINSIKNRITQSKTKKSSLLSSSDTSREETDMSAEQEQLNGLNRAAFELDKKEKQLYIHRNTIQSLLVFLKDDGVKGSIAKQYLPYINQKTNEYLDALNLWVNIEFDSEFGVSMSAPDRKGQEIAALSTGQMRRIDLAVLLAWRDIAKIKSSVDTNILIMDETLENLSAQGVADFVEMFGVKCEDTSLFVMTQRNQEFSEFFERTLHFSLKDGFSVMKEEV